MGRLLQGLTTSAGGRERHCFTGDFEGDTQDTALEAAAATAVVASDLRVFSLAGGKERAIAAAR